MNRPTHVPEHLVVDYDVFGSKQIDEIKDEATRWRTEKGPVVWSDQHGGHWVVLDAELIRQGLTDVTKFDSSSRGVKISAISNRERMVPIELDGGEHAEYRRMLNPLFTPARTKLLGDKAQVIANALLDEIVTKGSCDVVSEYARPLASTMFLGLVDWPLDDRKQLEHWVELELNGIAGQTAEQNAVTQGEAIKQITDYCMEQVALREGKPAGDDMTSYLMSTAAIDGQPLPPNRLIGMLMLLMIAGLDTTQSVTSQGIGALALDPSKQEYLRSHPDELPMIVEEILRYTGPAGPNRAAVRDIELGGVLMKEGDRVNFMVPVANRDPSEFGSPDELDFEREVNRHMTFGLGPHKCIGAALARTVLVEAFSHLHRRLPVYRLAQSSSHLGGVWGMNEVTIEWDVTAQGS